MKYVKLALGFLACILLAGCGMTLSASGPQFSQVQLANKQDSVIYVYRQNQYVARYLTEQINLDKQKVGLLRNEGYLPVRLSPGIHRIDIFTPGVGGSSFMKGSVGKLILNAKPGKVYFAREVFVSNVGPLEWSDVNGTMIAEKQGALRLVLVPYNVGMQEIQTLRLSN